MNEETEIEMTTDEALISALQPRSLSGAPGEIELEPFSLMRQVISVDLCHSGASSLFNAVMTVWVCTLSAAEALKAHEDIAQARLAAFAWAEAQGYSILEYQPLVVAYARLNRELGASARARIKGASEDGSKNDGGPAAPLK